MSIVNSERTSKDVIKNMIMKLIITNHILSDMSHIPV